MHSYKKKISKAKLHSKYSQILEFYFIFTKIFPIFNKKYEIIIYMNIHLKIIKLIKFSCKIVDKKNNNIGISILFFVGNFRIINLKLNNEI